MTFKKIESIEPVVEHLTRIIKDQLASGQRVLWLVPGGSAIIIAAAVAKALRDVNLSNLVVTLTDERYGEIGHTNSNWLQLQSAGFNLNGALAQPILSGKTLEQTTADYAAFLDEQLNAASYRLGLFGMGDDGHTAGILPHSSAVSDDRLAHGYDAGSFQRITMTPTAIARLDQAVLYARGSEKHAQLDKLVSNLLVLEQPAQCLKKIKTLTIYSDYTGDPV